MSAEKWLGRYRVIEPKGYLPSFARKEALSDHEDMLRIEFAGQSELLLEHALTITAIRRSNDLKTATDRFYALWQDNEAFLLEMLDTRWLISACDTIIETSSDQHESAMALAASVFANTVKMYETERHLNDAKDTPLRKLRAGRHPLEDGVTMYGVVQGDMLRTLTTRVKNLGNEASLANTLFKELIDRQYRVDTIWRRMHKAHLKPWPSSASRHSPFEPNVKGYMIGDKQANKRPGFIIVNDTSVLSGGYHIGPMAVINTIRNNLEERGFNYLGSANDEAGIQKLTIEFGTAINGVVLNGEGTLHHNAARGQELMKAVLHAARDVGAKSAIVNAGWEANSSEVAQLADQFDLVEFRDQASKAEFESSISSDRVIHVTPDLSLGTFCEFASNVHESVEETGYQTRQPLGVIDCVVPENAAGLQKLSENTAARFYSMTKNHANRLRQRSIRLKLQGNANPTVLALRHLLDCDNWVTGRYHGLLAVLSVGRPVVAVNSNTSKIENLFADIGLPKELVLPKEFFELTAKEQTQLIDHTHALWTPAMHGDVSAFLTDSQNKIEDFFDRLASMFNAEQNTV